MLCVCSSWAIALPIAAFISLVTCARIPIDEVYRRNPYAVKQHLARRDLLCTEDDTLLSLQQYSEDSIPFCSSYLSIPAQTAISTVTEKTTTVAYVTTTPTVSLVATVASDTITVTTTEAPALPIRKRQASITAITPFASISSACKADDLSVISRVSSACSCMFPPQTTITLITTTTSTRTENGIDYIFATYSSLVTSGQATVTVTVNSAATGIPVPSSGFLAPSSGSPNNTVSFDGGSRAGFPGPSSSVLYSTVASLVPTVTLTPIASTGFPAPSSGQPNDTVTFDGGSTAGFPGPSSNVSNLTFPSFTPTGQPIPIASTGFPASGILPPVSVNITGAFPGAGTGFPTLSPTSPIGPNVTGSSLLGTGFPASSSDFIPNFTGSFDGGSRAGFPGPTDTISLSLISPSGAPTVPTNGSSPTANNTLPTGNVVLDNCPVSNGTTYTTLGQTFEILCDTNFLGPIDQGLFVSNFYECIKDCAIANIGFSGSRCWAASFIPNNGVGSDCFFRDLNSSRHQEFDPKATSAILLDNTVDPNITYTASNGASIPSSGPTGLPNINTSSVPFTLSISANAAGAAAGFPSPSAYVRAPASARPIVSIHP